MDNDEIWKPIPGYEGRYWASNLGRIKSRRKILKTHYSESGYEKVSLYKHGKKVHRLVMAAFEGEKPYPEFEVNHKDGDRSNNKLDNLEYVTHYENLSKIGLEDVFAEIEKLKERIAKLESELGGEDER